MIYKRVLKVLKEYETMISEKQTKEEAKLVDLSLFTTKSKIEQALVENFNLGLFFLETEMNNLLNELKEDSDGSGFIRIDTLRRVIVYKEAKVEVELDSLNKIFSNESFSNELERIISLKDEIVKKAADLNIASEQKKSVIIKKVKSIFEEIKQVKGKGLYEGFQNLIKLEEQLKMEDISVEVKEISWLGAFTVQIKVKDTVYEINELGPRLHRELSGRYLWSLFEDETNFSWVKEDINDLFDLILKEKEKEITPKLNKMFENFLTNGLIIKPINYDRKPSVELSFEGKRIYIHQNATEEEVRTMCIFYQKMMSFENARQYGFLKAIQPILRKMKEVAAQTESLVPVYGLNMNELMKMENQTQQFVHYLENFYLLEELHESLFESTFWDKDRKETILDYHPRLTELYSFTHNDKSYRHFVLKGLKRQKAEHLVFEDNKKISYSRYTRIRRKVNKENK